MPETPNDLPDLPEGNDPDESVLRPHPSTHGSSLEPLRSRAESRPRRRQIIEGEAHEAARDVWNGWAKEMLAEKEKLIAEGRWAVEKDWTWLGVFGHVGTNAQSRDWLERAAVNFNSLQLGKMNREDQPEGNHGGQKSTAVKILYCVLGNANFNAFVFPGDADFSQTMFTGGANFNTAAFAGDASFNQTSFAGEAWINAATFKGSASFGQATFTGDAYFSQVTFTGNASFSQATFTGNAYFSKATFAGVASFNRATFPGIASFHETTFTDSTSFGEATFAGDTYFSQSSFDGNTRFDRAVFSGAARFDAIHASRAFVLANARFETSAPDFNQAHFTEAPRLDKVSVPIPKAAIEFQRPDTDDPARYRELTRIAEKAKDHDREHVFFKGQMRAERKLKVQGAFRRVFNRFYDVLSDYGRSALRPLFWLVASTGLFAVLYGVASTALVDQGKIAACGKIVEKSLFLALANALPAISGGQRQSILNAYECLYGDKTDVPVLVGYLGVVQTLLSVILLFLIALALRNMFRIK